MLLMSGMFGTVYCPFDTTTASNSCTSDQQPSVRTVIELTSRYLHLCFSTRLHLDVPFHMAIFRNVDVDHLRLEMNEWLQFKVPNEGVDVSVHLLVTSQL